MLSTDYLSWRLSCPPAPQSSSRTPARQPYHHHQQRRGLARICVNTREALTRSHTRTKLSADPATIPNPVNSGNHALTSLKRQILLSLVGRVIGSGVNFDWNNSVPLGPTSCGGVCWTNVVIAVCVCEDVNEFYRLRVVLTVNRPFLQQIYSFGRVPFVVLAIGMKCRPPFYRLLFVFTLSVLLSNFVGE